MLERLVLFSVRRRYLVLALSAIVSAIGLGAAPGLPIDAVPDVTNVQVAVLTPSPGLSPLEVEQYLTYPIEMSLNGLPDLEQIRSISRTGVSAVTVVFKEHVSVWFARQLVSERLRQAEAEIPSGFGKPELGPVATGLGDIYEFVLHSEHHTPMELRTTLDWVVAPRLRQVPGVIEVNALGGEAKQYQVLVDPRKLHAHRVPFSRVLDAVTRNNGSVGGGYIEKGGESFVIRADGLAASVGDLEDTVVLADKDGTPVLLKQVAEVRVGPALRFGSATQSGRGPVVVGTVMMLIGSNSREVVAAVKQRVDEIQKDLPEGMRIEPFNDRATFIDRVLKTVFRNLAEGALLVLAVLLVALGSASGSAVAALAIPVSMLVAVMGMRLVHVDGNVMSLGAIDFGLLVDGAIVMLEAVLAHLALRRPARDQLVEEIGLAASRVARPVAFSVAIILLVYLPLMTLEGVEGKMFRPMAVTVAMALGGALLFTLTTFPAALAVVARAPRHGHEGGPRYRAVLAWYGRMLGRALARPRVAVGVSLAALAIAGVAATRLGADFVPRIFEGQFSVDVRRLPSISIAESERLGIQMEETLAKFPEVRGVVSRSGRPEVAVDPVGPDEAEVDVLLEPREEWVTAHDPDELAEKMKEAIEAEVPATFPSMSQPIEDRVNQLLAGSRADVVVKIFGEDLTKLRELSLQIAEVMRKVPGTGDLRAQRVLGLPLIEVKADRKRLARYGISIESMLEAVESSRVGKAVGKVFEGPRRFDVVVKLPPPSNTEEGFGSLPIASTGEGPLIPISQLAQVSTAEGPAVINREMLRRRVLVEANVRGRDLVSYVNEARSRVEAEVKLPEGYRLKWGGQFENFSRAANRLALVVPMALGIIFGMLFAMFGTFRHALAVFASVPFALIGGVVALALRGLPFSIPAGVGFIALCGVAVLNGVVMTADLVRRLPEAPFDEALLAAARAVFRPVITTAVVAALGFLPMAISDAPGSEVQRPLATVVIGGILSSTALTLLVLPVVLRALCAPARPSQQPRA